MREETAIGPAPSMLPSAAQRPAASLSWLRRKHAYAIRLALCFVTITASVVLVGFFGSNGSSGNVIWIANGLFLAYLLLAPRWCWPAYLAAGLAALILGSAVIHEPWQRNLFFNVLDTSEVLVGALLLRRRSTQIPRFTDGTYLLRFIAFAAVAGPLLSGTINALVETVLHHRQPIPLVVDWISSDGLGTSVACPIFVAIFQTHFRITKSWNRQWHYLLLMIGVTIWIFAQARVPLLFLIYPVLVLVLLRLGLGWAAAGSLFVAFSGAWFTVQGKGPLAAATSLTLHGRCLLLQVFVATGVFMLYSISVVLESRRAIESRLQKIVSIHTLVTENSSDAIILSDFNGHLNYVSAAIERLAGWPPEEFARTNIFATFHPEDVPKVKEALEALSAHPSGVTFDCRIRKKSGDFVWVESSLRHVNHAKTGAPTGVLNILRDASERKLAEEKLQEAYKILETLAATDALTGLANRRQFDQILNAEWRRGLRETRPLSLLMIDADLFKAYNDRYGHPKGDNCLKQIAEAALDVITRPGDLVARFGGEEFAVILPNTDSDGALEVAQGVCDAMRNRRLPHDQSPVGVVTVSVGCATMMPAFGRLAINLVELADEALYAAKSQGRNRVCRGRDRKSPSNAAQGAVDCVDSSAIKSA